MHAKALALPKKFLLMGIVKAFAYHLAFGAIGGVMAGLLLWAMLRSYGGRTLRERGGRER